MSSAAKDRVWDVDGDPLAITDEELQYAIAEAAVILSRVGGAVMIVADREEIAPDLYQTTRYIFKWSSYAPAKRQERTEVEEPVAV